MVQHIAGGFVDGLVTWLNSVTSLKVKLAADGEPLLMQAPVPRFASGAAPIRWSGQPLGAANAEVYGGLLGLAETEIDHLRQDGVL